MELDVTITRVGVQDGAGYSLSVWYTGILDKAEGLRSACTTISQLGFNVCFIFEGQVSEPRNKTKRENRFNKSTIKQGQQGSVSVERRQFSHTEYFGKMQLLPKCKFSSQNKPWVSLRFWALFWCDNNQNNEAWLTTFPRMHFINSQSTDIKIYYFLWAYGSAIKPPSHSSWTFGHRWDCCASVLWFNCLLVYFLLLWVEKLASVSPYCDEFQSWGSQWMVLNDTDATCDVSVWVISGTVRWWTHEDKQLRFCDEARLCVSVSNESELSFTQPLAHEEWDCMRFLRAAGLALRAGPKSSQVHSDPDSCRGRLWGEVNNDDCQLEWEHSTNQKVPQGYQLLSWPGAETLYTDLGGIKSQNWQWIKKVK